MVLSLVFAVVATLALQPSDAGAPPRRTKATPSRVPAVQAEPPSGPPEPLASQELEAEAPKPAEKEASPACSQASDCRGPKLADCILASCEAGRCVFDRSSCECVEDGECDDGVECTRDLCFAATKKCIHIRSACK